MFNRPHHQRIANVLKAFNCALLQDAAHLKSCLVKMHMEQTLAEKIPNILATQIATLQQYNRHMTN